jgi:hypothetical protein
MINLPIMKKLLFASLALALACNATQKQTANDNEELIEGPVSFARGITAEELKTYLYTYASDDFEGRETGTAGQKKAVEFLRSEYLKLGVPGGLPDGEYFQEVPLEISNLPNGSLSIDGMNYEMGTDFLTFSAIQGKFDEIVFAGYGVEEGSYSDYEGLDVKGKIVLIKSGEPRNEDGTYVLTGNNISSVWSNMTESIEKKTQILVGKGAKGILYFDAANYNRYQRAFDFLANSDERRMSLKRDSDEPALILLQETAAMELFPDIKKAAKSEVIKIPVQFDIESNNEQIDSENVVAVVKGRTKPDEYLIISSHLDHIGITDDGKINNGADDDGSGSVAMLEIAEAFKQAAAEGQGPGRTIVFLHVTGEEKGLLGSEYYTDENPVFPLKGTVANLNIDMIGRTDPKREGSEEYIYLIGSDKLSSELHRVSEEVNDAYTRLELDYTYNDDKDPNRFYYRSDHYNFAKNNIPIIFYFNGTHEDYHRPTDTPDKIQYDLLAKRARLIFYTAWELANRQERVMVDKVSK